MAAITKVTVVLLVVTFVALIDFGEAQNRGSQNSGNQNRGSQNQNFGRPQGQGSPKSQGNGRHFVKRSADHQENFYEPAYETAFEGPHRIRVLPGFLH